MKERIVFLTIDEVLAIHRDQLARYGGREGVRERGLLESALSMPTARFNGEYLHLDLSSMAAAYLFHLAQNHPFVDGNKRVAVVAALVFLMINGSDISASEDSLEELVLKVARGEIGKREIAQFFSDWQI